MEGEEICAVLPPDVAVLAELLLERLDAATGNWRVELHATDGRLRKWGRQEEGGRDMLARFNVEEGEMEGQGAESGGAAVMLTATSAILETARQQVGDEFGTDGWVQGVYRHIDQALTLIRDHSDPAAGRDTAAA